jgi:signal transduction histidine kinase
MIISVANFFYRSMFGQLLVLSTLFLSITISLLVIRPFLEFLAEPEPLEATLMYAVTSVSGFAHGSEYGPKTLEESVELQEVKSVNPNFSYYLKINDTVYSSDQTEAAYWDDYLQLPNIEGLEQRFENIDDCASVSFSMSTKDEHGVGHVYSNLCGNREIYYEVSGISQPLPKLKGGWLAFFSDGWLWASSREYLISAGGIITLTILILYLTTRSIRKVTQVTESFDPLALNCKLPERHLPMEVLPLVQAVNQLMSKVDQTKEQQNFFLSTAAHEMRTPLTILRTRLEELPDTDVKDQLRNDVRRLTLVVNQLLKLMRINDITQVNETVELHTTLKKVIAERAPDAIRRNVDLVLESEVKDYTIKGDQSLLEIALVNLIDNAVSFSKPGDIVRITLSQAGVVEVIDSGPGINENIINNLFEPFAKNPPNRDGHGLGLAIVKAVIDLHQGEIIAKNRPSKGAVFKLVLTTAPS